MVRLARRLPPAACRAGSRRGAIARAGVARGVRLNEWLESLPRARTAAARGAARARLRRCSVMGAARDAAGQHACACSCRGSRLSRESGTLDRESGYEPGRGDFE